MASELINRDMYGGELHVTHNPTAKGRAPRYVVTEGDVVTKPKGVTSILGATLAKDFTDWAVSAAMDYLKTKLPVVTQDDLDIAAREYIRLRNAGGSTGTEAHAMVEHYLKGQPQTLGSVEANNAFAAFVKWFEQVQPEVLNVEEIIYSRTLKYAGAYDGMLSIDGKVYLTDLKTTNASRKAPNGVYSENFVQLGGYSLAHHEQRQVDTDLPKIEGLMVISAKKNGKLDIVTNEDVGLTVEECEMKFREVLGLHNFMTQTTKILGGR